MIRCNIYYGDGVIFKCNEDTPLSDIPTRNVQVIVYEDSEKGVRGCGSVRIFGWEFYVFRDGEWMGKPDRCDLEEEILDHLGRIEIILKGFSLTNDDWNRVYETACADEDFPTKSAINRRRENGNHPTRNFGVVEGTMS